MHPTEVAEYREAEEHLIPVRKQVPDAGVHLDRNTVEGGARISGLHDRVAPCHSIPLDWRVSMLLLNFFKHGFSSLRY